MMNTKVRRVVIQDQLKSGCDWESGYAGLFNGRGNVLFHNWLESLLSSYVPLNGGDMF